MTYDELLQAKISKLPPIQDPMTELLQKQIDEAKKQIEIHKSCGNNQWVYFFEVKLKIAQSKLETRLRRIA